MRVDLVEVAGAAMIAGALAFLHPALALGWLGLWLFVSAILAQLRGPAE